MDLLDISDTLFALVAKLNWTRRMNRMKTKGIIQSRYLMLTCSPLARAAQQGREPEESNQESSRE